MVSATFVQASEIQLIQLLMPSTIPLIISLPQFQASEASPFTKFTALLKPLFTVSTIPLILLEIALLMLSQIFETVDLMEFITLEIVVLIVFQIFDTTLEMAFKTLEIVDEMLFQIDEITDQTEFRIPEIKPEIAFHTVVITL